MACLHPITVVNPRYRNMTDLELLQYCQDNLVEGETYFLSSDPLAAFPGNASIRQGRHIALPIDYLLRVPCGKCPACIRRTRSAWAGRLLAEAETSLRDGYKPTFVTFTFSNEYLPHTTLAAYEYLRLFMDRFRKRSGYRPRYFFATEVSPHGRMHFHGIIYNTSTTRITYEQIRSCWTYGFCWLKPLTENRAHYCCKYVVKGSPVPEGEEYDPARHKTRCFTANGVGLAYASKLVEMISFNFDASKPVQFLVFGNHRYPLHPYIKSKLYTDSQRLALLYNRLSKPIGYPIIDGITPRNGAEFHALVNRKLELEKMSPLYQPPQPSSSLGSLANFAPLGLYPLFSDEFDSVESSSEFIELQPPSLFDETNY